ncbi:tRNA lysidine(34) synthetase TilS [Allochromatium tepidum]|uniref:tRNA(Ile)-lysidine synthase n=1 Tax=Allochromatium tepidum TaxID=553982 RepID=A0ABM7QJ01_9GAMM|nr:tRNA lysidine(34) synthetase TilS [Allochromatium tepidum]BCU05725.1 tRNA(Ile)-lysidine synthase [Allochromatium tepidum]
MTSLFTPEALLERLAPLGAVPRYWIAYSGGLDSSVLLDAFAAIRERLAGEDSSDRLMAVHVDHGLQAASADWAEHCAAHCAALNIRLRIERPTSAPNPGGSLEAWAREARYASFRRLLAPGDLLLTAQHRDDQAETLLLALLRGSGPHGLAAMPVVAPLGAGRLVRPLLDFSRQALVDYAYRRELDWIEDPSNDHTAFDRNYLRHRVLPLLRARWPSADATLSRSARHCAEAAELVDQYAVRSLAEARGARPGALSLAALARLDRPLRKAVVRLWLVERGFRLPDTRHLDRLLDELPAARDDANPCVAWSGCEVRRYRGDMLACRPLPPLPSETCILWRITGEHGILELPAGFGRLEWRRHPGSGSSEAPPTPMRDLDTAPSCKGAMKAVELRVRFGRLGDSCRSAANRPRRALKKRFQEAGVPVWLRGRLPLIFQGERLIAIAGVGVCHGPADGIGLSLILSWSGFSWEPDWPGLRRSLNVCVPADTGAGKA